MVAPFSRPPRNFSSEPFANAAGEFSISRRKPCGFLLADSTASPDNTDRNFASFRAPLSIKFSFSTLSRRLGLITSDVAISRSQVSNSALLMTSQKGLRIPCAGSIIIPVENRRNPSISCLRFVPSRTHNLLSRDCVLEKSTTVALRWFLDFLRPSHCHFYPFGLFGRPSLLV